MTAPGITEASLEASCAAADELFGQLYVRFEPRIRRIVRSKVTEPHQDDCQQIILLELLQALRRGQRPAPGKARAWISTIATRVALDYRRSLHNRHENEIAFSEIVPEEAGQDAIENLAPEESIAHGSTPLTRALPVLSQKLREVVDLHYTAGVTTGEIAEILGVSVAAVKRRIERALKELRRECGR